MIKQGICCAWVCDKLLCLYAVNCKMSKKCPENEII